MPDTAGNGPIIRRSLRVADLSVVCTVIQDDFVILEATTAADGTVVPIAPAETGDHLQTPSGPAAALAEVPNWETLVATCRDAAARRIPVRFAAEYVAAGRPRILDAVAIPVFDDNDANKCRKFVCSARDVASDYFRLVSSNNSMPGIAGELAAGLEREEFALHYQPIFEVRSGRMTGAEAFVRWNHPRRGVLEASEFIPSAEKAGLINDLGDWVLWEACAQAAKWNRRTNTKLGLTVNVSPRQIESGHALRSVIAALAASGLDPSLLTVDIPAAVLIGDRGDIPALLAHLGALGVEVAVDDFGLDYQALLAIREMAGRTIKIDRSLIAGVHDDSLALQTLTDLVAAYKPLDLVFTAEGVETEGELKTIRSLGFDFAQGRQHAPPMDSESFDRYLAVAVEMPLH